MSVWVAPMAGSKGLPTPDLCGRTGGFPLRVVERGDARATGKKASALGSQDRLIIVASF